MDPILCHSNPERSLEWWLLPALRSVLRGPVVTPTVSTKPWGCGYGWKIVGALLLEVRSILWYVSVIFVLWGFLNVTSTLTCKCALIFFIGDRYCTANVHQLLHFADSVRNLGPLWAHSSFPFEDTNGWLTDLFHGSRDPQKQVCVWIYDTRLYVLIICFL